MTTMDAVRAGRESEAPDDSAFPKDGTHRLRMKDLCAETGLPRQAIHFYIQQGLLPAGHKTGRNMALYGPEHVERLKLIKKLQHERFLPLKAIKALLDGQEEHFAPAQRNLLLDVKQRLTHGQLVRVDGAPEATVRVDDVCARTGVPRSDVDHAIEIGLIGAREDDAGALVIAADDAWLLESWAELRRLGYSDDLGLRIDDLVLVQEVVDDLFNREALLLASRIDRISPERAAGMIEQALPIVHQFINGLHTKKIRAFFASLE
jgi:DNA-binding transcriptional MerR regulator